LFFLSNFINSLAFSFEIINAGSNPVVTPLFISMLSISFIFRPLLNTFSANPLKLELVKDQSD